MQLLATGAALALLEQTARREGVDTCVASRLDEIHELFAPELSHVERTLLAVASDGQTPATRAAEHLLRAGGKRIRSLTVLLSAACFGPVPDAARELAVVAELVHSATLLHDDVIDDAALRRGRPAARQVWGNAVSVLAGDLLLTHALDRTLAHAPATLSDLLVTLRRLVDGEVIQLRGRSDIDASEAVYFRVLEDKTASLFGWSARAGATVADASPECREALGRFGERVGVAFQLIDDALDYEGDCASMGKAVFSDLEEGKLTLPLVLAIDRDPSLMEQVVLARSGDAVAAERVGRSVRAMGVCQDVRARAAAETGRAVSALCEIPSCPATELLAVLATELAGRSR